MQIMKVAEATTADKSLPEDRPKEESKEIPTIYLHPKFSNCSRTDLAILISRMLTFLIQINDSSSSSAPDKLSGLTRFHSRVPPNISVYNYLLRLTKYSSLEHCVLLTAVYYIDLLSSVYPIFKLNSLTVHRFLLTATTVASKGLCDSFCTNTHYAKVGGVHSSELNILECEFLKRVNYRILPRDNNIDWCKLESKFHSFSLYDEPTELPNIGSTAALKNSGYNVLNAYFRKIVQLVGPYDASPDKSKAANYALLPPSPKENCAKILGDGELVIQSDSLGKSSTGAMISGTKRPSIQEAHSRKRNLEIEGTDHQPIEKKVSELTKSKKQTFNQKAPTFT
ncbi:hypothetical protein HG536_0H04530 [Torulaspora globosa]|uniref:Cyclin-like domain-containing protein n=1 Tax=Torulaspora globosa TaxID=48254 RepID=A0A7G3ZNJ1_9SACH|nr:uncharacterized protein HG536_0H04530 [Torulaspora globosa]QLL35077.1 hypothetical protein HG536_0H04530 [Torulaspora globosa]